MHCLTLHALPCKAVFFVAAGVCEKCKQCKCGIKKYALQHEARYGRFPKTLLFAANGDAAEMDCIALVSFTHTHAATGRLFYGQACCLNELHCACEFYTHTHAAGGIADKLARSWPQNHAKREASFQCRPPTVLGGLESIRISQPSGRSISEASSRRDERLQE
jgi:hypothetical protein